MRVVGNGVGRPENTCSVSIDLCLFVCLFVSVFLSVIAFNRFANSGEVDWFVRKTQCILNTIR